MILGQQPSLLAHLQRKYDRAGAKMLADVKAWVAVRGIFTDILHDPGLEPMHLAADSVDERQTGCPESLDLILPTVAPRVKWIVSSRNWPEVEEKLAQSD